MEYEYWKPRLCQREEGAFNAQSSKISSGLKWCSSLKSLKLVF